MGRTEAKLSTTTTFSRPLPKDSSLTYWWRKRKGSRPRRTAETTSERIRKLTTPPNLTAMSCEYLGEVAVLKQFLEERAAGEAEVVEGQKIGHIGVDAKVLEASGILLLQSAMQRETISSAAHLHCPTAAQVCSFRSVAKVFISFHLAIHFLLKIQIRCQLFPIMYQPFTTVCLRSSVCSLTATTPFPRVSFWRSTQ